MGRKKRRLFLAALAAKRQNAESLIVTPAPEVVEEQPIVAEEPVPVVEVQESVVAKPAAKVTKAVKAK